MQLRRYIEHPPLMALPCCKQALRAPCAVACQQSSRFDMLDHGCPSVQVLDQSKSPKGGLKVKSASGNAAKAGISAGNSLRTAGLVAQLS